MANAATQNSEVGPDAGTLTNGEDEMIHPTLDVVDFHPFQALQASHVDLDTTLSTAAAWRLSMYACRAQMGSQTAMNTRAPESRRAKVQPSRTSEHLHTNARFRPIVTTSARMMSSLSGTTVTVHVVELELRHAMLHIHGRVAHPRKPALPA